MVHRRRVEESQTSTSQGVLAARFMANRYGRSDPSGVSWGQHEIEPPSLDTLDPVQDDRHPRLQTWIGNPPEQVVHAVSPLIGEPHFRGEDLPSHSFHQEMNVGGPPDQAQIPVVAAGTNSPETVTPILVRYGLAKSGEVRIGGARVFDIVDVAGVYGPDFHDSVGKRLAGRIQHSTRDVNVTPLRPPPTAILGQVVRQGVWD